MSVTKDRLEFDGFPAEPVHIALCKWLQRHSIDPNDVCVPGWIERSDRTRRVCYLTYVRDGDGRVRSDPLDFNEPYRVVGISQLEAPPLPWPDVIRPSTLGE